MFGDPVNFHCVSPSDFWAGGIPPGSSCSLEYYASDGILISLRFYDYIWPKKDWRLLASGLERLLSAVMRPIPNHNR